jgi:hypothetical protein
MSVTLSGSEGELVNVRVAVDPRSLEDLLETLAELSFPVNPQILHGSSHTAVEFPAWAGRLSEVRRVIESHGFSSNAIEVHAALGVA